MKILNYVALIVATLLSNATQALDWRFQPRITTGIQQYQYKRETNVIRIGDSAPGFREGIEVDDSMLFAGFGATASFGNFFVDVSFQKSDKGEDDFTQTIVLGNQVTDDVSQREMEREEFSLSVGYTITERFGIFAGYNQTEANFEDEGQRAVKFAQNNGSFFDGGIRILSRDVQLKQDGFFLSTAYVWPFQSEGWLNGALSIDWGVAFLDGEANELRTLVREEETVDGVASPFNSAGDAIGLNIGITWSGPLTDRLGYSLGMDYYDYSYDSDGAANFSDTLFRLALGLSYVIGVN